MKKLNKIVLIFLSVVVIANVVNVVFHEGTHWIQLELDDRVEPVSIKIYPACGAGYHACVMVDWTTDNREEQTAWNAEKSKRESVAELFSIIGTTLFLIVFAKVLIRRGWL